MSGFRGRPKTESAFIFTILVVALIVIAIGFTTQKKQIYPKNLWKGVVAEAVGEGEKGMYAVTCVYRNRLEKGMPLGSVGIKRKDLNEFVEKQGRQYEVMAKRVIKEIFRAKGKDITRGATHFENTEVFGTPSWSSSMIITTVIGNHIFYVEK